MYTYMHVYKRTYTYINVTCVDSVEHEHVTAAELAAVIAMWQAVGDAGGEDKFTASKLSLGNPSDSDLREVYVCFFGAKIG